MFVFDKRIPQSQRKIIKAHRNFHGTDIDALDVVDFFGQRNNVLVRGIVMMFGMDMLVGESGINIDVLLLLGFLDICHNHVAAILGDNWFQEIRVHVYLYLYYIHR